MNDPKILPLEEKILPVEEMLAYEEFTDRVEILRELIQWVKNIQRMTSPSAAIISPRAWEKQFFWIDWLILFFLNLNIEWRLFIFV